MQNNLEQSLQKEIVSICNSYNNDSSQILSILQTISARFALSADVLKYISIILGINFEKVNQLANYTNFFAPKTQQAKNEISVCTGTTCCAKGGVKLLEDIKLLLNINVGQNTANNTIKLTTHRCTGACGLAPLIIVNKKVYGKVNAKQVEEIIHNLQK